MLLVSFILFSCSGSLLSQVLEGQVLDSEERAAATARLHWLGTEEGTIAGPDGMFSLSSRGIEDRRLIVSYPDHHVDTFLLPTDQFAVIRLVAFELEEVEIREQQEGTFLSIDPLKQEVITERELLKGACCDLAGCFNTQASVQPITTNFITNSKELRILGLSGVYNQILIDGFPMMIHGQTYTYGISTIPGPLVSKIYVAKGANSVLQGFESISGQINVLPKSAAKAPRLHLNVYANSFLETQYNVHFAQKLGKWRTILAGHSAQPARTIDRDGDAFLDVAKVRRYSAYNQWQYQDEDSLGFSAKISGRFIHENRQGGQTSFDVGQDLGSNVRYGQVVGFDQSEVYTRVGYRIDDDRNLVAMASAYFQDQDSWFGVTRYQGQQVNGYANLQYEWFWKEKYMFKTGLSYRHVNRLERIVFTDRSLDRNYNGSYRQQEYIPGVFAENTWKFLDNKMTVISGVRLDHHNNFGWRFTPRALMKYDFDENTSTRVSAGTGWRTANIFTENINLLASSRDVIFTEPLQPEQAMNFGINFSRLQQWENVKVQLSLDAYHIRFQNQIFPDYNSDPTRAYIGNFTGPSMSNGFQVEAKMELLKQLELKASYNYLDVFRMVGEEKVILPFNSLHRVHTSASFSPRSKSWQADANLHWYGPRRLTNTKSNPLEFQRPESSEAYAVLSGQLSKFWDKFSIYAGCENLFDFRQLRPIVAWQAPFSPYFDTANVWGPTRGREFYLGMRFTLD